jgi:DNA-binding IclR family transcriptional regulator
MPTVGRKDERANGTNQSVERALAVLKVFGQDGEPRRVTDVAKLCGLGTSTTSRLLATLVDAGFLERLETGSYQLGRVVITLAGAALNQWQLYREAKPVAYEISRATGLGANVAEMRDNQLFYIVNFDGPMAPRAYTLMGRHNPLHATGLGKCLISELSPAQRSEIFAAEPLHSYTPRTIVDVATLERELALVRQRGYATEREELGFSRGCVAAPIHGRDGTVVAAISTSGPLSALAIDERENELARITVEAADRIASAIGAPQARRAVPASVFSEASN